MRSMMVPLVLLGGLTLAGSALAADAAPQDVAVQASASKVAIDPVTGKRRPITAGESRALDVQAARDLRTLQRTAKPGKGGVHMPATQAQSLASAKTVNGITAIRFSLEDLSSINATIGADGKVVVTEGDATAAASTQELPNE